jgi:hypothetical protein
LTNSKIDKLSLQLEFFKLCTVSLSTQKMAQLVIDDDTTPVDVHSLMYQLQIASDTVIPSTTGGNRINTNLLNIDTENIATYNIHETPHNPDVPPTHDIRSQQVVATRKWRFVPLFKDNANGKPMIWWVGFDATTNELMMVHGQVDGKLQNPRTQVEMNQHSKSMHEQSVQEASHRVLIQYRNKGYRPEGYLPPDMCEAALCTKWDPNKTKIEYPVYVQPKLDGQRVLARETMTMAVSTEDVRTPTHIYRSRGQKQYPRYANHFDSELNALRAYLPLGEIDSEGMISEEVEYIDETDGRSKIKIEIDFQHTESVMRTEKTEHPDLKHVKLHIFDYNMYDETPYDKRYEILINGYNKYIRDGGTTHRIRMVSCNIAYNKEDILKYHSEYVKMGYEGIIIRKIGMTIDGNPPTTKRLESARYRSGKNSNILKYKLDIDEEGIIIGVEECKGTEVGAAKFVIQDPRGNQFRVRMIGPVEQRRHWFKHPEQVIGKVLKYRFQELTNDGIPRFPRGISFRTDHE